MAEIKSIGAKNIRFYFEHDVSGDPLLSYEAVANALEAKCSAEDRATWFPQVIGGADLKQGDDITTWIDSYVFKNPNNPSGEIKLSATGMQSKGDTYCYVPDPSSGEPTLICYHTYALRDLESKSPFQARVQSTNIEIHAVLSITMPSGFLLTIQENIVSFIALA